MSRTFLRSLRGFWRHPRKPQGSGKGSRKDRLAWPPPYLYFMPVPRPVLSRSAPARAGGRGTGAARDLGPGPPPPGGFPCPPPAGPPLPPPGPGRGPHRRSSLLRLRRFCSVHAIDTCMPVGPDGEGGSEGAEGGDPGNPRADSRGYSGASPGRAGRLRRLRQEPPGRIGPAGADCWRSQGWLREGRNAGDSPSGVIREPGHWRWEEEGEMDDGKGRGRPSEGRDLGMRVGVRKRRRLRPNLCGTR